MIYKTDDGAITIAEYDNDLWLTQAQLAKLFEVGVPTIHEHIQTVEVVGAAVKRLGVTRKEGSRSVVRELLHYNLAIVVVIAQRVRSPRGKQFVAWAAARAAEGRAA